MYTTSAHHIKKLDEDNYESWKLQMRSILVCNELWPYVNGDMRQPTDPVQSAEWTGKDEKALALILLSVKQNQLTHIKKTRTSKEAWDELETIHKSKGPVRKAALYKQLYQMKKGPDRTMSQHVCEFLNKAEQLEEAGIQMPSELLSVMLLNSLPEEYENFCVAIESRDDLPKPETLKVKLIEEEARRVEQNKEKPPDEQGALLASGKPDRNKYSRAREKQAKQRKSQRFEGNCFNCARYGHRAAECRNKKKNPRANCAVVDDAMSASALSACSLTPYEWCLDSGATTHMCSDRQKFIEIDEGTDCVVQTAATHIVKSAGIGTVKLNIETGANRNSVKLQNVMFVPELRNNLISVPRITENGYSVTFKGNYATIKRKDGSKVMRAKKKGRLYVIKTVEAAKAMSAEEKKNNSLMRWHQRYGHLNAQDLKNLQNKEMVIGMDMKAGQDSLDCEVCAKGKINQLPYKASTTRQKDVLALVHTDICGPINIESLGGSRYFVTFIDDKTRYIEVKMLKNRSSALNEFKKFKLRVEKLTGHKIRKLRSDNAKEYISKEFTDYLESEGISRQLSVEYTPQQNGIAERANRTLVEMARCMLIQSALPQNLWAEAVNTAAFIRNRCPTKILNDKTPFEMWNGKKPYVGFMRVFGSKVIALEKGRKRGKFEPKGREYLMVGYSEESKAYRLWDQETNKVIKRRDVKFIEDIEKGISQERHFFDAPLSTEDSMGHYPTPEKPEQEATSTSPKEAPEIPENPTDDQDDSQSSQEETRKAKLDPHWRDEVEVDPHFKELDDEEDRKKYT